MQDAAHQLAAGGVGCIVLCTNTIKLAVQIESSVAIPFLQVAAPTAV